MFTEIPTTLITMIFVMAVLFTEQLPKKLRKIAYVILIGFGLVWLVFLLFELKNHLIFLEVITG